MNENAFENRYTQLPPSWIFEESSESDVLLGVSVCSIRNYVNYPFPYAFSEFDAQSIENAIEETVGDYFSMRIPLRELSLVERLFWFERLHITAQSVNMPQSTVLRLPPDEKSSIIINSTDHISLKIYSGTANHMLVEKTARALISLLGDETQFARHRKFGYLAASPAFCGSGIFYCALLHLPCTFMLNRKKQLDDIVDSFGMSIMPILATSGENFAHYMRLMSKRMLCVSVERMLQNAQRACAAIIDLERRSRALLLGEKGVFTRDKILRAYGIAEKATYLQGWEFFQLISLLRLGATSGVIPLSRLEPDELLFLSQRAHIMKSVGTNLTPMEISQHRSRIVCEKLFGRASRL